MLNRIAPRAAVLTLALGALVACGQPQEPAAQTEPQVVNVYSSRHYDADAALFAAFEKETGISVRTIEARGDELIARLKAEGASSPADLVVTVDAGNLWRLTQEGILQPVQSETLNAAVPEGLRDAEGRWFAIARRARVIVYAPDRVDPAQIASLDALAQPAFKGKVCARTSGNIYNLSLLAARIERDGADAALAWARGVAGNFARDPQGSDTDQIRAIAAGVCDVAIVNHYYLLRMAKAEDPKDREIAQRLAMTFPDQAGAGAHVNISGAGVAANAPNRDNAVRLLEFLVSEASQAEFSRMNDEYPIRDTTPLPAQLQALGPFKADGTALSAYGARQAEAQALYEQAGWR